MIELFACCGLRKLKERTSASASYSDHTCRAGSARSPSIRVWLIATPEYVPVSLPYLGVKSSRSTEPNSASSVIPHFSQNIAIASCGMSMFGIAVGSAMSIEPQQNSLYSNIKQGRYDPTPVDPSPHSASVERQDAGNPAWPDDASPRGNAPDL